MLDVTIPLGDLPEQAGEWERGIDEITERDDDMRAYIGKLEEQRDAVESPEASGEALAHEFERFLRSQPSPRQGPVRGTEPQRPDAPRGEDPEEPGEQPEDDAPPV